MLFATNGGDNSVSSFRLDKEGRLAALDVKRTGNPVEGKSGTAKSLAYAPSKGILYVLDSFGPDHVRCGRGSWGGRRLSLADYVMGTRPTDRAGAAGGH